MVRTIRTRVPLSRFASRKEAVALAYDPKKDAAPKVVAKGRGAVAAAIVERAEASGVPVVTDQVALEALRFVEVDQEIPPRLYRLVAEILAFVYNLDERGRRERG